MKPIKIAGSTLVSAVLLLFLSLVLWQFYQQNYVNVLTDDKLMVEYFKKNAE